MKGFIRKFGVFLLAGALFAAFAWVALTQGPLAPPKVVLAAAREADLAPQAFGIGTVEARYSYAVGAVQPGRLLRVLVDQGDTVTQGQLLAELDPVDLEERLGAARNATQRARHAADAATAQLAEAGARRQHARASAARFQSLALRGFVSGEAVEGKNAEANAAEAAVEAAASAQAGAREEIARATAEAAALAKQRDNLRLLSPVDGLVTGRDVEPGTTVVAGQAVARMIDPRSIWVRVRIDQGRAAGIRVGQPADIVLRSHRGVALPGHVARIELTADTVTEERLVDVAVDKLPAGWSIGELAEVTIALTKVERALSVPSQAVKRVEQRTGVWRISEGRARFTPVEAGASTLDGRTQILKGLAAGDEVVVHSERALDAGARVRVVDRLSASRA